MIVFDFKIEDRDRDLARILNIKRLEEAAEALFAPPKVVMGGAPGPALARDTVDKRSKVPGSPANSKVCGENDLVKVNVPSGKYLSDGDMEQGEVMICKNTA